MSTLYCSPGNTCPFLYSCTNGICLHDPILAPNVYTGFVYALLPIMLAFVNVGGLSGGFLKVPILMDLLNYSQRLATFYTYPLTFGAGLANFILLLPQRHPTEDRPVVDYNIVIVLLPCVVIGTTLGVLLNDVVPEFGGDILIILLFSFISLVFFKKYRNYQNQVKLQATEPLTELPIESSERKETTLRMTSKQTLEVEQELVVIDKSKGQEKVGQKIDESTEIDPYLLDLQELLNYDKGMKLKDVAISFAVFIVFEVLALLVQGKLYHFKICESWFYATLFVALLILFSVYLVGIYLILKKRFLYYKIIGYQVTVDISGKRNFIYLVLGGFLGGISSGLIGLGSGDLMIIFMGLVGVPTKIASATSGYQILFIGGSSLIQALAEGQLGWIPLAFFATLAFVGSFILSIIAYRIFDRLPNKGQGPILITLTCLSVISLVGVIPNVILTSKYYGFDSLLKISGFRC